MDNPVICSSCVLPSTFPGIKFNDQGVCNFCQASPNKTDLALIRNKLKDQMKQTIQEASGVKNRSYDCVVAFSGGKDSSYTLSLLVEEYGLKCLAITIDNGFVSEQALANCRTITSKLGVDFLLFTPTPKFMNNMYNRSIENPEQIHSKLALTRASSVCNSCISLINTYMIKVSLQQNIPIIAGGYIGGQVPKDGAVMKLDLKLQQSLAQGKLEKFQKAFGPNSNDYFAISDELLKTNQTITLINPMLTVAVSEEEIIDRIKKYGWIKTKDTGHHSSNCRLNDLAILMHLKRYHFHPYVAEVADQVRAGTMTREVALKKINELPKIEDLTEQAKKLGLIL